MRVRTGLFFVLVVLGGTSGLVAQQVPSEGGFPPLLIVGTGFAENEGTYTSTDPQKAGVQLAGGASAVLGAPRIVYTGLPGGTGAWASEGSRLALNGGVVRTSGDESVALRGSGDSTIDAKGTSVITEGDRSGGIVVEAAGGTVQFADGSVRTRGQDSPGLSSAGVLQLTGTIVMAQAEAAVIEGAGTIRVADTVLVGTKTSGVVFVPGLAEGSQGGVFTMEGGSLTAQEGPLFWTKATRASVSLHQATLVHRSGELARVEDSDLTVNAVSQDLKGDVALTARSTVKIGLRNGSTWTGSGGNSAEGTLAISIDGTSVWTLTGDAWVATLTLEGSTTSALGRSVVTAGHTLWYRASSNGWLVGRTITLDDGGVLKPY